MGDPHHVQPRLIWKNRVSCTTSRPAMIQRPSRQPRDRWWRAAFGSGGILVPDESGFQVLATTVS